MKVEQVWEVLQMLGLSEESKTAQRLAYVLEMMVSMQHVAIEDWRRMFSIDKGFVNGALENIWYLADKDLLEEINTAANWNCRLHGRIPTG